MASEYPADAATDPTAPTSAPTSATVAALAAASRNRCGTTASVTARSRWCRSSPEDCTPSTAAAPRIGNAASSRSSATVCGDASADTASADATPRHAATATATAGTRPVARSVASRMIS